jgi:hypothetical protein
MKSYDRIKLRVITPSRLIRLIFKIYVYVDFIAVYSSLNLEGGHHSKK